jgi:hypothetical protein
LILTALVSLLRSLLSGSSFVYSPADFPGGAAHDPGADEVIELGMLKFEYGQDGHITRMLDTFNCLQQPKKPIPAHITAITGITNEEVAG